MTDEEAIFSSDVNKEFEERTKKIVEQALIEKDEERKRHLIKDKLQSIRNTVKESIKDKSDEPVREEPVKGEFLRDIHTDVNCPSCKKHSLHIHDGIAKCTGIGCGKEYLLKEKGDKRKDYICTTCGESFTKEDILKMKEKTCISCGKGKDVVKLPWENIYKELKERTYKAVNLKPE